MTWKPAATFSDLPPELHISVARYIALHPRDLFSVLKTCKALHTRFSSKEVWDSALNTVCTRDAQYKPSYPVASMTVLQLQRAVMAPNLWNARLRTGKPFLNAYTQTLSRSEDNAQRHDYNRVYFVPGGRYLFEQARGNVSLWDLGLPALLREQGAVVEEPRIVDTIEVDDLSLHAGRKGWDIVVHPTPDGKGLRVWIVPGSLSSDGMARFVSEVYEIRTQEVSPKFKKLSRLDILMPAWAFSWGDLSMRENQAVLHSLDGIFVWDYINHRYAVWSIREYTRSRQTDLLFLSQSSIYLVQSSMVMVWDIPFQLHNLPEQGALDLLTWGDVPRPPPRYIASYKSPGAIYKPLGRTFSHWYNALDTLPALYDVLEDPATVRSTVARYRVDLDPSTCTAQLHRVLTFPFPGLDPRVYCLHRVSDDTLFTLYQQCKPGFEFGIVFTPLWTQDSEHGMDGRDLKAGGDYGIIGIDLKGQFCSFTFCSASGRVAYSTVEGDREWGKHSINVLDYWHNVQL